MLLEAEAGSRFQLPALHVAAKKDDVKSLSLLLKSKHDPNSTTAVTYLDWTNTTLNHLEQIAYKCGGGMSANGVPVQCLLAQTLDGYNVTIK